jgi:hypothetical protein
VLDITGPKMIDKSYIKMMKSGKNYDRISPLPESFFNGPVAEHFLDGTWLSPIAVVKNCKELIIIILIIVATLMYLAYYIGRRSKGSKHFKWNLKRPKLFKKWF